MPFRNVPNTLTLPPDAGPGDPRIVIGGDIPPPLDTYVWKGFLSTGSTLSGIFFFLDATSYGYIVEVEYSGVDSLTIHIGYVENGAMESVEVGRPNGLQFRGISNSLGTVFDKIIYGDGLQLVHATNTEKWIDVKQSNDTHSRFQGSFFFGNDAILEWGSGSAAPDVNLYRSSANLLKTDDSFEIAGEDIYSGTGAWNIWAPNWVNKGTATFTSNTGRWKRVSQKTVLFSLTAVINAAGSNVGALGVDMPTAIDRAVRYQQHMYFENAYAHVQAITLTGGSGTTIDRIRDGAGANVTGASLTAGRIISMTGFYQEA